MRIVAGEFRGRTLVPPSDRRVRVTGERVREAWMSRLTPQLPGARVLDLFAGSGALGLEALSRGAAHVTFVDLSPKSLKALHANIAALGVEDRVTVRKGDALRVAEGLAPAAFDVALADPPYATGQAERLAAIFRTRPFARVLCVEHERRVTLPGEDTRSYGDVALTFLYAP